ncbi:hypothetical protein [Thermoclostridium stercorarium]|uniref:hypothetical protein n=1 Tax=Thermoclostridium stercorarium TaxID=1510 RepID=UPI001F3A6F7A|nr:hypothetical protein [Thermoclostridium stercorarium]
MKFKSITVQISLLFGLLMSVISTGLGLSTYITASDTLADSIDESLLQIAEANAKVITEKKLILSSMPWKLWPITR